MFLKNNLSVTIVRIRKNTYAIRFCINKAFDKKPKRISRKIKKDCKKQIEKDTFSTNIKSVKKRITYSNTIRG